MREHAQATTDAIARIIGGELSDDQRSAIVKAVEQTIITVVLHERERCVSVAHNCCPEDRDRAHQIAEEIHRAQGALVANLQGMR